MSFMVTFKTVSNSLFCLDGFFSSSSSFSKFLILSTNFHSLFKNRQEPSMPASYHSISRSGGESDNIKKRAVSAPKLEIICCGSTTFFFDLLIFSVRPANTGLLVSACKKLLFSFIT